MPSVDAVRAEFLAATGTAWPRTVALLGHPRLYQRLLDMEAMAERVPSRVGPYKRSQLLAWDAETTAWEAWDTVSGHRVHLVAGAWTPPMRTGVLPWREGGPGVWVSPPIELSLADLLPDIDDDPVLCAQVLTAAVAALPDLYGTLGAATLVRHRGVWTVSGIPGGEPNAGARGVGRVAALFGTHGEALAELAESPEAPPELVAHMLRTELADRLIVQVHRLRRRPALEARARRVAQVRRLADRLAVALRPRVGRGCLAVNPDGSVALLESDGRVLRGGVRGSATGDAPLGILWRDGNLDGQAVRPLLRLWSSRRPADEDRRAEVQARIGGDDAFVERTLAFLRTSAHLRVDRMLLGRG